MLNFHFFKTMFLLCLDFFICNTIIYAVPLRYIPKLPEKVKIDGNLDENFYRNTQPIENFKIAGQPASEAPFTQAWIFWNEEKLVFSYNCVDRKIAAKPPSWNDLAVAAQDRVEFYIGSGNEEEPFICFEITPLGAVLDYRANYYRFLNFAWKPETLQYAVSLTPQGYCMEAELSAPDFQQAKVRLKPGERLRIGLFRSEVDSVDQNVEPTWITWIDASEPFPDFHTPRSLGEMVLEDDNHPGPTLGRFGFWEVGKDAVKLRPKNAGNPIRIKIDEIAEGWKLIWTGRCDDNAWALLENKTEYALISDECRLVTLTKPDTPAKNIDSQRWYGGKNAEEILASPRDILGEPILQNDWIDPDKIAELLPPIANGYQILGSPLTGGVSPIITRDGKIRQGDSVLFDPAKRETRLSNHSPETGLLDGWMPIAHYRYSESGFEYLAYVPVWERGTTPSVYIRLAENGTEGPSQNERFWSVNSSEIHDLERNEFWSGFVQTVFHWKHFESRLSLPVIPDPNLLRVVKGSLALAYVVFAGEHPHYGAREYGATVHDTFPPAFIAVLETAFRYGESDWAKSLIDFWFRYCVNDDGTIRYWQRNVRAAASASEYGMIYTLLEELDRAWGKGWGIERYFDRLEASVHYLHSLRQPIQPGGNRLIRLGAEADNAELQQAYFSNNLWAARGLDSLSKLFERYHRKGTAAQLQHIAQDLFKDTQQALTATAAQTPYGLLPPIYPGYAALPLTLSAGIKRPETVEEEIWRDYLHQKDVSIPVGNQALLPQNLRENTYANYRYYLEMLSSGGLPSDMAEAIARLRADRGGELLGMTRFDNHLDDWPVAEWAKYLLSTDRWKNYWLLLYSHIAHHQDRDTLTAFEQVGIDGNYYASDCIPSQLTAPRMLAWAFAYEFPGDERIYLLRGIPQNWYQPGNEFGWSNIPTSAGEISIRVIGKEKAVDIKADLTKTNAAVEFVIQVNLAETPHTISVLDGSDSVEKLENNRIYIRASKNENIHLSIQR